MFHKNNDNDGALYRSEKIHTYKKHPIIRGILICGACLGMALGVIGTGAFLDTVSHAPKLNVSALKSSDNTKIYDANGNLMSKLGAENRTYIKYKNIPPLIKNALISTEDRNFYHENGISPTRTFKAALNDVKGSGGLQGGSTLSQQLIKLSVFNTTSKDRNLTRKAQEAWLSVKMNHNIPKDKILEYYMNKVFLGYQCYGFQTASEYYFNKPLNKLTVPQAAMLAGMPQNPNLYGPYLYPKFATQRRNQVINAMVANHKLSVNQAKQAKATPINKGLVSQHQATQNLAKRRAKERVIDAYLKATLQQLHQLGYRQNAGLKIYTNMSPENQNRMYQLANDHELSFPNNQFQIGGALVQAGTGKVNAMIGGRENALNQPFSLDRAMQTGRSSGSTSKPFEDYAPAIQDLGWGTEHTVFDTPFNYGNAELYDWDHKYQGPISLESALVQSRNIPAVRTLQHVGLNKAKQFMRGFDYSPIGPYSLQSAINLYISPLQEAEIYASFANGGTYHQPQFIRKIVEPNGVVHNYNVGKGKRAMMPGTAYAITKILEKATRDQNGDPNAHINGIEDSAGKSGTTQYPENTSYPGKLPNYAVMDSNFTGYTPNYSLALWSGYDDPNKMGHYIDANQINIVQKFYAKLMKYAMTRPHVKNTGFHQPKDSGYSIYKGYFEK